MIAVHAGTGLLQSAPSPASRVPLSYFGSA
jgi:hypothetical protein